MKVAIIGGGGRMGRWFADYLLKDGKEVVVSGRTPDKLLEVQRQLGVEVASNVAAVEAADVVLLSVPMESLEAVVAEIAPHIQPHHIVIDITSTKVFPVETMHRHIKDGQVLGVHPLFGPGAAGVRDQNFVLTPTNDREAALAQKVGGYLEARGGRVMVMAPQEHDDMMTIVLGLSHYVAIVAADTLLGSDKLRHSGALGGITYKVLLTLVESVLCEDPELYASIQMNLPGVVDVERLFQKKAREWADLVQGRDRAAFIERMKGLRERLEAGAPDFGKAYRNLYKIASEL